MEISEAEEIYGIHRWGAGYCSVGDDGRLRVHPSKEKDVWIGKLLEIDPEKETFVGDSATPEALALLTREYRKGFEVPEKV